jgi:hypothetical protein
MNSRKSTQKCSWTNCFSERGKYYRLDCREGLLPTSCKQGCCIKIESLEFESESNRVGIRVNPCIRVLRVVKSESPGTI